MVNFEELNYKIFQRTNSQRVRHTLSPLVHSKELSLMSSLHSTQMKKFNFFSHTNPYNPILKDLNDRVSYFNLQFSKVSENIADIPYLNSNNERFEIRKSNGELSFYSKRTKEQLFYYDLDSFSDYLLEAWMNSKGHRKNILDPTVTHLGCGAVLYFEQINKLGDKIPRIIVTQNFGRL